MDNRIDNTAESRKRNVDAGMRALRNSQSADEQRYFLGMLRKLNLTPAEEAMVREILSKRRKYKP